MILVHLYRTGDLHRRFRPVRRCSSCRSIVRNCDSCETLSFSQSWLGPGLLSAGPCVTTLAGCGRFLGRTSRGCRYDGRPFRHGLRRAQPDLCRVLEADQDQHRALGAFAGGHEGFLGLKSRRASRTRTFNPGQARSGPALIRFRASCPPLQLDRMH